MPKIHPGTRELRFNKGEVSKLREVYRNCGLGEQFLTMRGIVAPDELAPKIRRVCASVSDLLDELDGEDPETQGIVHDEMDARTA